MQTFLIIKIEMYIKIYNTFMPNIKVKQTSHQTGTVVWAESAAAGFCWTISGGGHWKFADPTHIR